MLLGDVAGVASSSAGEGTSGSAGLGSESDSGSDSILALFLADLAEAVADLVEAAADPTGGRWGLDLSDS